MMFANLVGLGLGPLVVGIASDALTPLLGQESLRYALLALFPGYLWVSWHLWLASRTFTQDLGAIMPVGSAQGPPEEDGTARASL
jgi:hypothetical protein